MAPRLLSHVRRAPLIFNFEEKALTWRTPMREQACQNRGPYGLPFADHTSSLDYDFGNDASFAIDVKATSTKNVPHHTRLGAFQTCLRLSAGLNRAGSSCKNLFSHLPLLLSQPSRAVWTMMPNAPSRAGLLARPSPKSQAAAAPRARLLAQPLARCATTLDCAAKHTEAGSAVKRQITADDAHSMTRFQKGSEPRARVPFFACMALASKRAFGPRFGREGEIGCLTRF